MQIDNLSSDKAILEEIGERVAKQRLNRNLTQVQLADLAGVSLSTVNRMEAGHSSQIANLIRVLRALNLLSNMDALIAEPTISPMQQLEMAGKQRQRARPKKAASEKSVKQTSTGKASGAPHAEQSSSGTSVSDSFLQGFQTARLKQFTDMLGKSAGLLARANEAVSKLNELGNNRSELDAANTEKLAIIKADLTHAIAEQERIASTFKRAQSSGVSEAQAIAQSDIERLGAVQQQLKSNTDSAKRLIKQLN